jgi:hypothetical protein
MATDFRRTLAGWTMHAQRPDGLQLVAGLYRAISVWREPNEVPSGVAREEF